MLLKDYYSYTETNYAETIFYFSLQLLKTGLGPNCWHVSFTSLSINTPADGKISRGRGRGGGEGAEA
jgi:hypothetical protein